jgi:hypothetical protein
VPWAWHTHRLYLLLPSLGVNCLRTVRDFDLYWILFPVRNPLDKIGPEVEALLRLLIWNFTLRRKRTSLGEQ